MSGDPRLRGDDIVKKIASGNPEAFLLNGYCGEPLIASRESSS